MDDILKPGSHATKHRQKGLAVDGSHAIVGFNDDMLTTVQNLHALAVVPWGDKLDGDTARLLRNIAYGGKISAKEMLAGLLMVGYEAGRCPSKMTRVHETVSALKNELLADNEHAVTVTVEPKARGRST